MRPDQPMGVLRQIRCAAGSAAPPAFHGRRQPQVEGLTGRTLRLNPAWVNPSGEWRVGARPLFELLPGGLCKRLKEERRKELVCR